MGKDKALLPFGGYDTLCEYQYRRLQKLFSRVYISTKNSEKFPFQADFIIDESDTHAPTAGFAAVYETLKADSFFAIAVDMPFVSESVITTLMRFDRKTNDATLAFTKNGVEALCGIYHRSLQPHFETMLQEGRHKLRKMLDDVDTVLIPFGNEEAFFNLNRPPEYQKAKEVYAIIS